MSVVSFTVYGVAAAGGSKRGFYNPKAGRVIITDASERARPWKAQVADAAAEAMTYHGSDGEGTSGYLPPLEGPLLLEVTFWLPRPKGHFGKKGLRPSAPRFPAVRPDATKLLRPVEDACSGIVWRDDAQVVTQVIQKSYGEPARCEIRVVPIERDTVMSLEFAETVNG